MKVTFKRAKRRSPTDIVRAVKNAAEKTADMVKKDYEGVVDNWETPVVFGVSQLSDADFGFNIYARGPNADIFMYVDKGTEKRYAVMRKSFAPRTTPGSLVSGGGGDRRPAYFDYDPASAAARAIEARGFGETIVNLRRSDFVAAIRAALKA